MSFAAISPANYFTMSSENGSHVDVDVVSLGEIPVDVSAEIELEQGDMEDFDATEFASSIVDTATGHISIKSVYLLDEEHPSVMFLRQSVQQGLTLVADHRASKVAIRLGGELPGPSGDRILDILFGIVDYMRYAETFSCDPVETSPIRILLGMHEGAMGVWDSEFARFSSGRLGLLMDAFDAITALKCNEWHDENDRKWMQIFEAARNSPEKRKRQDYRMLMQRMMPEVDAGFKAYAELTCRCSYDVELGEIDDEIRIYAAERALQLMMEKNRLHELFDVPMPQNTCEMIRRRAVSSVQVLREREKGDGPDLVERAHQLMAMIRSAEIPAFEALDHSRQFRVAYNISKTEPGGALGIETRLRSPG